MNQQDVDAIAAARVLLTRHGFVVTPAAPSPALLDARLIAGMSFQTAMADAARHSGMDDQSIASQLGVSCGYFSKFARHVGEQWARRMVLFMNSTNSRAPLQWLASRVDCEIIDRRLA